MGLFSKKDPCAICGGKVKGVFPKKIEGQYVCSDCYGIVDLPEDTVNHMSVEDFRGYMTFREGNDLLRQQFQTTQQVDFGWLDDKFLFDMNNRLLCMDKHLNKTIFEGGQIKSFVIKEDSIPLLEGSAAGLCRYISTVPDRAMALIPQIDSFRMRMQMHLDMERLRDRMDGDGNNNSYHPRPHLDVPEPFRNFNVEIRFDHPYWDVFTADMSGPTFDNTVPDVNDYLHDYERSVQTMEELAQALMALAFPGAPEQVVDPAAPAAVSAAAAAPAAAVDAVEEIQRYKALLDQGILTEEEFTAKKRQLLGI